MKKKILISINPEHVQNIIKGIKKYEYRKIAAKQDISSIIIYETNDEMKKEVLGIFVSEIYKSLREDKERNR